MERLAHERLRASAASDRPGSELGQTMAVLARLRVFRGQVGKGALEPDRIPDVISNLSSPHRDTRALAKEILLAAAKEIIFQTQIVGGLNRIFECLNSQDEQVREDAAALLKELAQASRPLLDHILEASSRFIARGQVNDANRPQFRELMDACSAAVDKRT